MKLNSTKKIILFIFSLIFIIISPAASNAGEQEKRLAEEIGTMLVTLFQPDSITVKISNGGSFAWAETEGANIDGIRIDKMKLMAMLRDIPKKVGTENKYELANLIHMSYGELHLKEKDVNNYFLSGIDTRGFSNLHFDFSPNGFKANGLFSAKFIFNIRIRLSAQGVLGLREDGVYLEDTSIFVEGVKQPDSLTKMIIGRVNPLLPFKKIPFPVYFKKITMTDSEAILTSEQKPFTFGESWSWHK